MLRTTSKKVEKSIKFYIKNFMTNKEGESFAANAKNIMLSFREEINDNDNEYLKFFDWFAAQDFPHSNKNNIIRLLKSILRVKKNEKTFCDDVEKAQTVFIDLIYNILKIY